MWLANCFSKLFNCTISYNFVDLILTTDRFKTLYVITYRYSANFP